ncbi:RluA family pseudouridine synthase [Abyssibius alkaniclasticus]|uniref:RluA family pseudouridine synthase n=1 Tax=Abyssibius alkaniclasticus TaxID=2881234 RepID=UPI004058B88D
MDEPFETLVVLLGADTPPRLDKALAAHVPEELTLSRSRIQALIAEGAVSRGGLVLDSAKAKVAEGDEITVALPPPDDLEAQPEDIPLEVLFEDEALIVVNKPAGMVVHPAPGALNGTLVNALLHHCGDSLSGIGGMKRPGIVHRIDKDTSGILVVAKHDAAHQGLAAQFAAHSAEREYRALCWGVPSPRDPRLLSVKGVSYEPGQVLKINAPLDRHRNDRKKMAVCAQGYGRHAVTRVQVLGQAGAGDAVALLACQLETGRTHQIRVHLAHAGHPLVGDQTYGKARKLAKGALNDAAATTLSGFSRQALHAATLGFKHPVSGEFLAFSAPLPADMANLLNLLGLETDS